MSKQNVGVIFDMDGVIIDNHEYHTRAWKTFWNNHDLEITDEQYNRFINGKTNNDIMRYLFGQDIKQHKIDELAYEKEKLYRDLYTTDIALANGLESLLNELEKNKAKMAVASAGPPENVSFAIERLNIAPYFSSVVDSSMVEHGKPNPEAYNKSLNRLGLSPNQCIIFEDSFFGIQAAKASGCTTIAISSTHTRKTLEESTADYIINSFEDINFEFIQTIIKKTSAEV